MIHSLLHKSLESHKAVTDGLHSKISQLKLDNKNLEAQLLEVSTVETYFGVGELTRIYAWQQMGFDGMGHQSTSIKEATKQSVEKATIVEDSDEEDAPLPPRSTTSKRSNKSVSSKSGSRSTAAQKKQLRAKKDLTSLSDGEDHGVSERSFACIEASFD